MKRAKAAVTFESKIWKACGFAQKDVLVSNNYCRNESNPSKSNKMRKAEKSVTEQVLKWRNMGSLTVPRKKASRWAALLHRSPRRCWTSITFNNKRVKPQKPCVRQSSTLCDGLWHRFYFLSINQFHTNLFDKFFTWCRLQRQRQHARQLHLPDLRLARSNLTYLQSWYIVIIPYHEYILYIYIIYIYIYIYCDWPSLSNSRKKGSPYNPVSKSCTIKTTQIT